jgi:TonB family protein
MIKTAVYLAGFYLIYFLFLSRDTLYARNRIFILASLLSSFILPLFTIRFSQNGAAAYFGRTLSEIIVSATGSSSTTDFMATGRSGATVTLFRIYIIGVAIFGIKLFADIIYILILTGKSQNRDGKLIRFKGLDSYAFSAFGYIFINESISEEDASDIISHEKNHLRCHHSIDIILVEILKVLQWFNPVIHMLNRSLRSIHEFQADEDCLRTGIPVKSYQALLINHLFRTRTIIPSNNFSNPSLIKKRMIMMTKKRSKGLASLKLLLVLPVAAMILLFFSACNSSPKNTSDTPPLEKTPIYNTVDVMPVFPGGDTALMNFIGRNIKYPESAAKNKIQGKVVLKFIVRDNGEISMVSVQTGVDPALDSEAVRVVKLLPAWTPGIKDGKNVNVWYAIPITFKLN